MTWAHQPGVSHNGRNAARFFVSTSTHFKQTIQVQKVQEELLLLHPVDRCVPNVGHPREAGFDGKNPKPKPNSSVQFVMTLLCAFKYFELSYLNFVKATLLAEGDKRSGKNRNC